MAIIREVSTVASVVLPIDERLTVRRVRYAPKDGGSRGRVCIGTGIHGDEMMGQLIVYGVVSRIMAHPDDLRGTVDVYPMLNPLSLDTGERMMPTRMHLDMNRAFPGNPDGTPLENICHRIVQDMKGADLVLDIHASTQHKSELYEVRVCASDADRMMHGLRALCPELIWVFPDKGAFSTSLAGALSQLGTDALVLEADERYRRPQEIAGVVIEGIFCKLKEMGIWAGDARPLPTRNAPVVRSGENICRVSCTQPGVYVPDELMGAQVAAGQPLGVIIDALEGVVRETVTAPCSGLVFSQRSYSAVYPGTLIARIGKEQA